MIVVKLWGGVGNQLFQYAFGHILSKEYDDNLLFDTYFYDNQPKYVGKREHINKSKFPNIYIDNKFKRSLLINSLDNRYIRQPIRRFKGLRLQTIKYNIILEKCQKFYNLIPYSSNKINYYIGYWQTAKYFEKYREELLNLYSPNQEIRKAAQNWRSNISSDCCVAVHIRRGDYVRQDGKSITQGVEYYLHAMEYMNRTLSSPLFCVFSDDIEWCKEQFKNINNITYVENRRKDGDLIDLFSISLCDHGIMSNSTFSWWGNWLRKDLSNSLVIYPKYKYSNEYLMPEEWKCLSSLIES